MSERTFLILGLPRSRTAWLSTLFAFGDVFCWHDLSGECNTTGQIATRLGATNAHRVGLSDSGLVLWLGEMLADWVPGRILFVRRDPLSAATSFASVTGFEQSLCEAVFGVLDDGLNHWQKHFKARQLDFEDIDSEHEMQGVWHHLVPDREFPTNHYRKLRTLNVQVKPSIIRSVAADNCGHFQTLARQLVTA